MNSAGDEHPPLPVDNHSSAIVAHIERFEKFSGNSQKLHDQPQQNRLTFEPHFPIELCFGGSVIRRKYNTTFFSLFLNKVNSAPKSVMKTTDDLQIQKWQKRKKKKKPRIFHERSCVAVSKLHRELSVRWGHCHCHC